MRTRRPLEWTVGHTTSPDAEPDRFVPATVPGAVQLDWARAEGWGDPHFGENWRAYAWMEDVHWVYRTTLPLDGLDPDERVFFVCGGVDYRFQVRLAGRSLHEQEGMFTPVELDLTGRAADGDVLEIVVFPVPKSRPEPVDRTQADASCKPAVSYGWDFHPRLVPSGIWRDTHLELRPRAHLTGAEVRYRLDDGLARAAVSLEYAASEAGGSLRWRVRDPDGGDVVAVDQPLTEPSGTLEAEVTPVRLWWPNGQGAPDLYRSTVELLDDGGRLLDGRESRVGFRRARLVMNEGAWDEPGPDDFPKSRSHPPITLEINGRRIFAKGSNWVCPDIFPGRVTPERYRALLERARDAHMNLIRCWGGAVVPPESFFEACDERGLMVWQDFPLGCIRYEGTPEYLSVLDQESRSIIQRLRPHPSPVVWCGGNELFNVWSGMTDQDLPLRLLNRNCYDLDPERPFLPTAPVDGMGHGHYVFRDARGDEVFQIMARASCTAYTEFGCPAPPDVEVLRETLPVEELFPPRPGTSWETHHAFGAWAPNSHLLLDVIEDYFGPTEALEQLVERGQLLQSEGLKCLFEEARRQWPRASMALNWCFSEPWPAAANLSLVAWPDRPKPALAAVGQACRPVLASARLARFVWREGEPFEAEVWLLNDSPEALPAGRVEAVLDLDGHQSPLLTWEHPAVPAGRPLAGPTARLLLPGTGASRMTLRLRCPGHRERDSEYVLLYRPGDPDEARGIRELDG
jgi:beta-mannosidase